MTSGLHFSSFRVSTQKQNVGNRFPPITSVGAISSLVTVSVPFTNVCVLSLCSLLHLDLEIKDCELQVQMSSQQKLDVKGPFIWK